MAKILFYISSLNSKGGAERALSGLMNFLSDNTNSQICVLVESGTKESSAYPLNNNIEFSSLYFEHKSSSLKNRISLQKDINQTISYLNPDIIVSFLAESNIRLLLSGISKHYPVIVCERNAPQSDPHNKVKRLIRDKIYRFAKRIIVQTHDVKSYFENKGYHNVFVIENFVNTIPLDKSVVKDKRIVTIGRLVKQKNQQFLIKAFAKSNLPQRGYHLDIYGDGPERENLEKIIDTLKMNESITLWGNVTNVLERIASATCFVLPSIYEGMPNALMEAMSMGLPCISTDCPCGGAKSLIKTGVNGYLIPINDEKQLIDKLETIIDNPSLAESLGERALSIRETHSLQSQSKLWEKVILNEI